MAKLIKMETGWKVFETGQFFEFGQISINIYNLYSTKQEEYYEKLRNANNSEEEQLYEEYKEYLSDDVFNFISVVDRYIDDIGYSKKGFEATKKFTPYESKCFSYERQEETHRKTLDIIKNQGWPNVPDDIKINLIDLYLMRSIESLPPLPATPHFINGKWYMAYDTGDTNLIAVLDLIEMRNCAYKFRFCKNCNKIYIQKDKKVKYCPECSQNYDKIASKNRPLSPRYVHKQVRNYMNNSEKFTANEIGAFADESDFYWDRIQGKNPKVIDQSYRSDIITEYDYIAWCKEKHEEFKKIAKSRKKI